LPRRFGKFADTILAVYPHATDAEAEQAARDLFRDTDFGWGTWSWARLETQYGQHRAYLYYFDLRTPRTPHGAPHGTEGPYVFGNDPGGVHRACTASRRVRKIARSPS
jgi:para-nitrobenzyl esterase